MKFGIDFGGTKTEIIAIQENGKEVYRQRVPTERDNYKRTVKTFRDLVLSAEKQTGERGSVGIAIPGNISQETGIVKSANTTWIVGKPFRADLEKALSRPVIIENDANCFAVSEAVDGAAKGKKMVFAIILGTGCGAGIAVDGKSWSGATEIAGEWGHNPLPFQRVYFPDHQKVENIFLSHPREKEIAQMALFPGKALPEYYTNEPEWNEYPGPTCYCGKRGCLERWISGTGLKRDYRYVTGDDEMTTHDIVKNAQENHPEAKAAMNRYYNRLARALGQIINVLDPDAIVVGGGMSNVDPLYKEVPKVWEKYIYAKSYDKPLLKATHGDSSGVRGAAWLWK